MHSIVDALKRRKKCTQTWTRATVRVAPLFDKIFWTDEARGTIEVS